MNTHLDFHPVPKKRNRAEKISMVVGVILFFIGLVTLPFPHVAGLNLTIGHCFIIIFAGMILSWNGAASKSKQCFYACLFFSIFFLSHAVVGLLVDLVFGAGVINPFNSLATNLLPDYFLLERNDHIFNLLIGLILAGGAYDWLMHYRKKNFIPAHQKN